MQIEQFFYWFFDPEWWLSATQGTVGALIGLIGLFLVFRLTRRHDLQRDEAAEDLQRSRDLSAREIQEKQEAENRLMARVASVMEAATSVQVAPLAHNEEPAHVLAKQLMLMYLEQFRTHPKRARWAMLQFSAVRNRLMPEEDIRAVGAQATAVMVKLAQWIELDFDDELFDVEETNQIAEDDLANVHPSVRVTRQRAEEMTLEERVELEKRMADLGDDLGDDLGS